MNDSIYTGELHAEIIGRIRSSLERVPDFLAEHTIGSTRAAGDAIERLVAGALKDVLGSHATTFRADFPRRAMEDIAFKDVHGRYHAVDVKTHRSGMAFSMPNLTSVKRLMEFYQSDDNVFSILLVTYSVNGHSIAIDKVEFCPVEFISWECLTIGALGWGQIQIKDSNIFIVDPDQSRSEWMLQLCDRLDAFYPREIDKIRRRIEFVSQIRPRWNTPPADGDHIDRPT